MRDAGWAARVIDAGVRLDLIARASDDEAFALLGATIMRAVSEAELSDEDIYPLLVRYWNGRWPLVNWPPFAPGVARRCATALAARGSCEMETFMYAPTDVSLRAARGAITTDLALTQRDLLAALADHWERLADLEMPTGGGCSLLAFAQHVLLEPVVGACALIWSTLEATTSTDAAEVALAWDEWCPVISGDGRAVVAAELARIGRPPEHVPEDADAAAQLLAAARAALLACHDGPALIAASIVRTSGWPGATDIIAPIAAQTVDLALQHLDAADPKTDNDELVDLIQSRLMPGDELLIGWARDPSFGTLRDPAGSSRTGREMLHDAADWLIWSFARAAVDVTAARGHGPIADA